MNAQGFDMHIPCTRKIGGHVEPAESTRKPIAGVLWRDHAAESHATSGNRGPERGTRGETGEVQMVATEIQQIVSRSNGCSDCHCQRPQIVVRIRISMDRDAAGIRVGDAFFQAR